MNKQVTPTALQRRGTTLIGFNLVLSIVLAFGIAPQGVQAQEAPVSVSIPAQPLDAALEQLGEQTGLQIFYLPEIVQGLNAPNIAGNLTADQALRRLLAGTGIEFRRTGKNVSLSRPASGEMTQLTPVTVTGTSLTDGITEGTGSYTTNQSSYGKGQTLKELPQAVTVMTHERIQDQGLKTLDDVLVYTPGITVQQDNSVTSSFYSRGFKITNFQIDGNSPLYGAGDLARGLNVSQLDLAMFDHVEVLRGSDALYGTSGGPGGAINLVRKKPTSQFQVNALAHAGSWNNYRGELDVSGSIMAGRIRGRLVGVYEDRKYFYDYGKSDKQLLYGIIEADITNSTMLTIGGDIMRQDYDAFNYGGLPRYSNGEDIGLPRSFYLGGPEDRWLRKNNKQFIRIDQAIGTDWTLGIEASRAQSKNFRRDLSFYATVDPITLTGPVGRDREFDYSETQHTLDAVLKGTFHLLGKEHKVTLGANINRLNNPAESANGVNNIPISPNIFEYNWNDYVYNEPYKPSFNSVRKIVQKGVYGSLVAQISDPLKLIFGGRLSWYKFDDTLTFFDPGTGAVTSTSLTRYQDNTVFTPYLGLVFDLTEQWSTYASIAETYQSQASNRKGPPPGTSLNPVTGRTYEIGVKGSLFNERLNTALAFFSIKNNGQAVQDPDYPLIPGEMGSSCCYLDDGRIVSRGVDIEVGGEIISGWQIHAGYTFNNNENKADRGRYSSITPKHLFKLWSSYELKGILDGLKLGGGITAQSSNYRQGSVRTFNPASGLYDGPSVDYAFTEPGYVLVDLFAQYRLNKHWSANLNINNIFDKKYYQTVGGSAGQNWYGQPRNFLVSMRYSY